MQIKREYVQPTVIFLMFYHSLITKKMQNFDVLVYEGRLLLASIKENFREAEESMMWFCGVTVSVRRD